jgi:hypothetical protein
METSARSDYILAHSHEVRVQMTLDFPIDQPLKIVSMLGNKGIPYFIPILPFGLRCVRSMVAWNEMAQLQLFLRSNTSRVNRPVAFESSGTAVMMFEEYFGGDYVVYDDIGHVHFFNAHADQFAVYINHAIPDIERIQKMDLFYSVYLSRRLRQYPADHSFIVDTLQSYAEDGDALARQRVSHMLAV